jgi:predicted Zn-dependent peptidase
MEGGHGVTILYRALGVFFCAVLATHCPASEFQLDVARYQLKNGLTVLLCENHTAPVVSYFTFFKAGSRNERPGITGISHFLEHMMFNGAEKYGPKMFDFVLESNGGYSNAYTTTDMTVYYENIAAENLELVIDLESDRMGHLALDPEVTESERSVIAEERLMRIDNNNGGLVYEELCAAMFMAHPYGWPTIGWMDDIHHISREDCFDYYSVFYAPNNALIVVTGDFDTEETMRLIRTYYASIESGPLPPDVVQNEPVQRGPRRVVVKRPAQYCNFLRGYHIGDKSDPDLYALDIIIRLLAVGESSRLYRALVEELQISLGLQGNVDWCVDPSLAYLYVAGYPGIGAEEIEHAMDSVLAEFITTGPSPDQLRRAQNGLTAEYYKRFKTNVGMAREIGFHEILFGDWEKMYDYVDRITAVTIDDIKRVAAEHFANDNSTTVILVPEGGA